MKPDENEQHYKKGPTPVLGKKANGKSQLSALSPMKIGVGFGNNRKKT
jgi:hypothetical protein